jgi:signal peptide peptidase SppA
VIPVSGVLLNRFGGSYGFATGYNAIRSQINAALADTSVQQIVLDVNSPGGMVSGCFELADDIRAAREQKPILAVVDGRACSAAYAIASQATRVVAAPSADIGSIGVVAMHVSVAGALEKEGVEVTFIQAGAHKTDVHSAKPLSDEARANIQAGVDASYEVFLDAVAAGRGKRMTRDGAKETEARVYSARDALALGLIDAVATPQAAFASFVNQEHPRAMTETTQAPASGDAAPDAAAIQAAERARVAGILAHAEAEGRGKLATHLATNTAMSVDDAAGILAAAPKEPAEARPVAERDRLADAMASTEQPNVGASGGEDAEPSAADRMLAAWSAATGVKIN